MKMASLSTRYTVRRGDNLRKIARRELGDESRWEEIFKINQCTITSAQQVALRRKLKMVGPDWIFEGAVLTLPEREA